MVFSAQIFISFFLQRKGKELIDRKISGRGNCTKKEKQEVGEKLDIDKGKGASREGKWRYLFRLNTSDKQSFSTLNPMTSIFLGETKMMLPIHNRLFGVGNSLYHINMDI